MEVEQLASDLARETVEGTETEELIAGINAFAGELLTELADGDTDNLFVSPTSLSLSLAMVWAGARGDTATELAETLYYPEDAHPAFNAFEQSLTSAAEGEVTLRMANMLWGNEGFPFEAEFLDTLARHYGTGVRRLDFEEDPEGARQCINEWVTDQTDGNVEELLPEQSLDRPGDEYVVTVLTNAIYMLADWEFPFEEEKTETAPFTTLDGQETDVELMEGEFDVPYAEIDGHEVVDLPYAGEQLSMTVVLPPDGEFGDTRDGLTGARLAEFVDATEEREGTLRLPRFEFSTAVALGETLEAMGMASAFDPSTADFADMYVETEFDETVALDEVFHEAYVEVDEEGTEAAAATGAVGMAPTSIGHTTPFEMVVDRPFLFAIRHRETGAVLFFGQVGDADAVQG